MKSYALFVLLLFFSWTSAWSGNNLYNNVTPPRWEKLGQRTVNFGLDHDEIVVTRQEGRFTALKL
ncbi:MAG: hypothetical protein R2795_24450, partial [Saprospiraceae bacterium]